MNLSIRAFLVLLLVGACDRSTPEPTRAFPDAKALYTELMARVDTDRDGRMSQAEYAAVSRQDEPFASLDTNQDGQVDVAELQKAVESTDPGYREIRSMAVPVTDGP